MSIGPVPPELLYCQYRIEVVTHINLAYMNLKLYHSTISRKAPFYKLFFSFTRFARFFCYKK